MSIYVVRHGETKLNEEGKLQGRNGEDLNENGIKQAKNLAQKLSKVKFDIVISSPQNRAIQTAKIISLKTPLIDKRIDVYDLGEADRMKKDDVEMMGFIPNPEKYNGVENFEDFVDRIKDFLQSIKNIENIKDLNILIVGHKCTVGAIDTYFNSSNMKGVLFKFIYPVRKQTQAEEMFANLNIY